MSHPPPNVRPFRPDDLGRVEALFKNSMLSVRPSASRTLGLLALFTLLVHGLRLSGYLVWAGILLSLVVHLACDIYIRRYISRASPTRNLARYTEPRSRLLVMETEGQIVGFTSVEPQGGHTHAHTCWVTYFFIDPQHQGKSLGLHLTDGLLEWAHRREGYSTVCGATSSFQTRQLRLQRKYAEILKQRGVPIDLELREDRTGWWAWSPVKRVHIIYRARARARPWVPPST